MIETPEKYCQQKQSELINSLIVLNRSEKLFNKFYNHCDINIYSSINETWIFLQNVLHELIDLKQKELFFELYFYDISIFKQDVESVINRNHKILDFDNEASKSDTTVTSYNDYLTKERKEILRIIKNAESFFQPLTFYNLKGGDLNELMNKYKDELNKIKNFQYEVENKVILSSDNLFELENRIATAGSIMATSKFRDLYYKFAEELGKGSMIWLFAMLVLAVAIFTLGYYELSINTLSSLNISQFNANHFESLLDSNGLILLFISRRIILFSVLFFSLYFCSKNYRISKHNEHINIHRAHALHSMEIFVASSNKNEDLRVKIIENVSNLIYKEPNTGYIKNNESDVDARLSELMNLILKKN